MRKHLPKLTLVSIALAGQGPPARSADPAPAAVHAALTPISPLAPESAATPPPFSPADVRGTASKDGRPCTPSC